MGDCILFFFCFVNSRVLFISTSFQTGRCLVWALLFSERRGETQLPSVLRIDIYFLLYFYPCVVKHLSSHLCHLLMIEEVYTIAEWTSSSRADIAWVVLSLPVLLLIYQWGKAGASCSGSLRCLVGNRSAMSCVCSQSSRIAGDTWCRAA